MKCLKRIGALALSLALSVSLLSGPARAAEEPASLEEQAAQAAQLALQYSGATSVQYALWQDGEILLSGSAGVYSKTENRLLTDDILYGVGSVSKIYTTVAMMQLVEAGQVDLDRPVTDYLPEFTMEDPRYVDITVRMLLNHSSGLMGGSIGDGFLFRDPENNQAVDELLDRLSHQTLQADPGAFSVYCNDGFTLAQLVIERVSGLTFTDYLEQHILEPLGLEHTFTPKSLEDWSLLAKTYLTAEDTRALPADTISLLGTGGLYASASDLAAFGGALCGEGLLSQESLDAMASEEYLRGFWPEDSQDDALAYGLGWDNVHAFPFRQSGIQALCKGGDTLLYHGSLVVLPQYDMAVAVLSSGGLSTYDQLAGERMLLDALARQGVAVEESAALPEAEPAPMPGALTALSGVYGSSSAVMNVTVTEDGVLSLSNVPDLGAEPQTFTYCSDGSFRDASNSVLLRLEEVDGRVYLYQKSYTPVPGLTWTAVASYALQRLEDQDAAQEVQDAWDAREGTYYVQMNERYTSQYYAFSLPFAGLVLSPYPDGYLLSNVLADAHTAVPYVTLPGTGSRDAGVIRVYEENGVEYLDINGEIYRNTSSLETVFNGDAWCTILADGWARWYHVGEAAGKEMTVEMPERGAWYVYDAAFQLVGSSWVWGDEGVVLPEGGWIVFAGDPGQRFILSMDWPAGTEAA